MKKNGDQMMGLTITVQIIPPQLIAVLQKIKLIG